MTDHPSPEDARRLLEGTTPGPWATCQWNTHCVMPLPWANDEIDPAERGPFAVIHASAEADARLIAAAPALAAALAEHEDCVPKAEHEYAVARQVARLIDELVVRSDEVAALCAERDEAVRLLRSVLSAYNTRTLTNRLESIDAFLARVSTEETSDE